MTAVPPVHAEQVPHDPATLLWHIPAPGPGVGRVVRAPGPFGTLLADGTLDSVLVARGLVWIRLAEPRTWQAHGARVRNALQASLAGDRGREGEPGDDESGARQAAPARGWVLTEAGAEVLRRVADHVIGTTLASYLATHGGCITVTEATCDTVVVRMAGSCLHCPAAGVTLHERVETAIRHHYPALARVREEHARPRRPLLWPRRRPAPVRPDDPDDPGDPKLPAPAHRQPSRTVSGLAGAGPSRFGGTSATPRRD